MKPEQLADVFARNLFAARQRAGLSQRELAARIGTSAPQILKWEKGLNSPTLDSVAKIAAALGTCPETLLTEMGAEILSAVPA